MVTDAMLTGVTLLLYGPLPQSSESKAFTSVGSIVIAFSVKTRARHNFLNYMKTVLRGST